MTMWRPVEPVGDDDVANFAGIEAPKRYRRSGRRAWRDGLAAQTVIAKLENTRSYRAFERAIVGSVSPRSVLELELARRLANLLWRLRRVSAIETGLFEIHGEARPSRGPSLPRPWIRKVPIRRPGPMATRGSFRQMADTHQRGRKSRRSRPSPRSSAPGRARASSPNVSCVFANFTRGA